MSRFAFILLLAVVFGFGRCQAETANELFRDEIRSLLAEKCFACHGPDVQEAGLRLDSHEAAVLQLDSGVQAIVPGNVDASELLRRVGTKDPDQRMPPEGDSLTMDQAKQLRQWIAGGAPYAQHWAYAPLDPGDPPVVNQESWIANPIDRYVLREIEQREIAPSPQADRATLIKRLYYDLVGLPPTIEAVDQFVNDQSEDAYEKLVDSLLESSHFGQRWGRHWLDKARYADSDGYEKDRPRPNAWKYRDWVIHAINDDMPVDQFTIEQLAGDLLPDATNDQRLATAFHRQTLTNTEGGVDQEEFRVEAVFDRTETTGAVWLGLTIGCARCHSHKYDAISQEEYYRLFAFFNNGDETNLKLPTSSAAIEAYQKAKTEHDEQFDALAAQIADAKAGWEVAFDSWQTELRNKLDKLDPMQLHDIEITEVVASVDGHKFDRQDDNSYLVSGENPAGVVDYTLTATANIDKPLTGVRIDALKDKRLSKNGPGRTNHGNFVLSELEVGVVDQPWKLTGGVASFSQSNYPVTAVVDGKLDTGWAISPKMGVDHHARFGFKSPQTLGTGTELTIRLRQHYGSEHAMGRFRIRLVTGLASADELAPEPIRKIVVAAPEKRNEKQQQQLADYFLRNQFAATKSLYGKVDALKKKAPAEPMIQVRVITQRSDARETKVLDRGSHLTPKHTVTAGGLATLPEIKSRVPETLDRLDYARWLMDDDNPLPPRVLANHVWFNLFGQGLVRTVNDFGVRGESPTHPKLLDWLAREYRRVGWSRKRFIRTILMSSTYRQSSHHRPELFDIDPQNLLLARQNRFRVPAEIVRDLCLSASGLLSDKVGGPSVFPPLPADVAALSYNNNFKWNTSQGADRYRRGMYTFFKRTSPYPNLTVFDCPDSNTTNVSRRISNTPLQALTVLNNEVYHEAAQALAARALEVEAENDSVRIANMLRRCIARHPVRSETDEFTRLLESSRAWYAEHPEDAEKMASRHQDDRIPKTESAAWIAVARIALNLDEFVTRE